MWAGWRAEAAEAARRRLAASPWPAVLARGAEPPGTPAIGGDGSLSGFGVGVGSSGFAGWLYAVASSVDAAGGLGSMQVGGAPEDS